MSFSLFNDFTPVLHSCSINSVVLYCTELYIVFYVMLEIIHYDKCIVNATPQ